MAIISKSVKITPQSSAPGSPTAGQIYYDTEDNVAYVYNGSSWMALNAVTTATGGTTTGNPVTISGVQYNIHTFLVDGTFTVNASVACHILVVGGGGGGGMRHGGGGGAGGFIYKQNHTFAAGTYAIDIGQGGVGSTGSTGANGTKGEDTTVANTLFVAKGGGMGACDSAFHGPTANNGGCGGGSDDDTSHGGETIQDDVGGDSSTYGFGSRGAGGSWDSISYNYSGKGGGGTGQQGQQVNGGNGLQEGTTITYGGTEGGTGSGNVTFAMNGAGTYYGGGGGAGEYSSHGHGAGGNGGGGRGASSGSNDGAAGTANTGGGGGGEGSQTYSAYAGGSGIVIIRYVA